MAAPPGSAAALADQTGSTYQREEAANGLFARPLLVLVELLEDELLELLLDDELLELDELEELEELLLELLLDDELELLLEDELLEVMPLEELELLLDDELLELDELEVVEELPLIEPAEAVRVTRSSRAPSSRRTIRSVCVPAARLLKVAGVMVP